MKILKSTKGFILAEAVITSVFVLGVFTFIVANVFPLLSRYSKYSRFDRLEDVFLAHNVYDVLALSIKDDSSIDSVYEYLNSDEISTLVIDSAGEVDFEEQASTKLCSILNGDDFSFCNYSLDSSALNVTGYYIRKAGSPSTSNHTSVNSSNIDHRGMSAYISYFNRTNKCKDNDVVVILRFGKASKASYSSFCVKDGE